MATAAQSPPRFSKAAWRGPIPGYTMLDLIRRAEAEGDPLPRAGHAAREPRTAKRAEPLIPIHPARSLGLRLHL